MKNQPPSGAKSCRTTHRVLARSLYRRPFIERGIMIVTLLLVCAGCNTKPTKKAEPELPPLQALPAQSLQGLNIQLPPIESPTATELQWIELASIEPDRVLFSDSFSYMGGYTIQVKNGRFSQQSQSVQSRMFAIFTSMDAVGDCSLSMREDTQTIGPDGRPGVLSMLLEVVPKQIGYVTFVYWGQQNGSAFNFAPIINAKSVDDLAGIQFRFRYKGENHQSQDKMNFSFDCRLGFESDVYENRLDLGRLMVTDQWQNHVVDFGKSPNVKNFVESISRLSAKPLGLAISQVGSIDAYRSGDNLLIDDIEVILPKSGAESRPMP